MLLQNRRACGIIVLAFKKRADVAQSVERILGKDEVTSSNLVISLEKPPEMAVFSYVLGRILQDSDFNPTFFVDLGFSGNFFGNFLSKIGPKKAGNIRLFGTFRLATFLAILPLLRAVCPLDGGKGIVKAFPAGRRCNRRWAIRPDRRLDRLYILECCFLRCNIAFHHIAQCRCR